MRRLILAGLLLAACGLEGEDPRPCPDFLKVTLKPARFAIASTAGRVFELHGDGTATDTFERDGKRYVIKYAVAPGTLHDVGR